MSEDESMIYRRGRKDKINYWLFGNSRSVKKSLAKITNLGISFYGYSMGKKEKHYCFITISNRHDRHLFELAYSDNIGVFKKSTCRIKKDIEYDMEIEQKFDELMSSFQAIIDVEELDYVFK